MEDHPVAYPELIDFLLGHLDKDKTVQVAQHLGTCVLCTGRVSRFVKIRALMREYYTAQPSPEIVAKVKAIPQEYPRPRRLPRLALNLHSRAINFAGGFAAALLIVFGLGMYFADQEFPEDSALYRVKLSVKGLQITASRVEEYFGIRPQTTTPLQRALGESGPKTIPGSNIVISQVYGGGGNSGSTWMYDFIELFNRSDTPVSLNGWSLQYSTAIGNINFGSSPRYLTELGNILIAPGQYILIQEARGKGGSLELPSPDLVATTPIELHATSAKVALVKTSTSLGCNGNTNRCTPIALESIVDLVSYGITDFYTGSGPAPETMNTTAIIRLNGGCTDTKNNASDFVAGTPNPRNSKSQRNLCPAPAKP